MADRYELHRVDAAAGDNSSPNAVAPSTGEIITFTPLALDQVSGEYGIFLAGYYSVAGAGRTAIAQLWCKDQGTGRWFKQGDPVYILADTPAFVPVWAEELTEAWVQLTSKNLGGGALTVYCKPCVNPITPIRIAAGADSMAIKSGNVTISDGDVTSAVSFGATPFSGMDYGVACTAVEITAGAANVNCWVSAKLATGFTINISAAPGIGRSVGVSWIAKDAA